MTKRAARKDLLDPLEDQLGYQIRRVAWVTLTALHEVLEPFGLRSTEALVLRLVKANPGCNQAELGRALGVKKTNMVPIIGGLIKDGLIDRTLADGRTHALRLTDKGVALHNEMASAAQDLEDQLFGGVDPAMQTALLSILHSVRKATAG